MDNISDVSTHNKYYVPLELVREILLRSDARVLHHAHPNKSWVAVCYALIQRRQHTLSYLHDIGIKCAMFMFIIDHECSDRYREIANKYSTITFIDGKSTLIIAIPFSYDDPSADGLVSSANNTTNNITNNIINNTTNNTTNNITYDALNGSYKLGKFVGCDELTRALSNKATYSWSYSFLAYRRDFPLGISYDSIDVPFSVDVEYTNDYIKIMSSMDYDVDLVLDILSPFLGRM